MIKTFILTLSKVRPVYWLITLTLFAGLLRFYNLGNNPPSLNLDEVAIGFNAKSIIHTGRDEYGTSFPIAFRSHDDYKAPLYIYLTTISIKLFGVNAFAIRFMSALAGTMTIPVFYLLCNQLFKKDKQSQLLSYIAALLLTISPWHLQFSRAAYETNVALFFVISGILAYFLGKKNPKYFFITAITFALSIYAYHSTKFFVPLISLFLAYDARKTIKKSPITCVLSGLLLVILVAPMIPFSMSPQGRLRFKGTSVFETPTVINHNQDQKVMLINQGRILESKLFHNKYLSTAYVVLDGFFKHLTFSFLFLGVNGPPRNLTPNSGLLYLWEAPFLIWGAIELAQQHYKNRFLLFVWLILAIFPSSLTWDAPSSTRTTLLIPVLVILSAKGIVSFISATKHRYLPRLIFLGICLFFFLNYLHNSHRAAPFQYSDAWQYGYKQAVLYAKENEDKYDKIVVSSSFKQPQNFFAFYSDYDPKTYIEVDGGTVSGGFAEQSNKFGKYEFHTIEWGGQIEENTLYIEFTNLVPISQVHVLKTINLLNGTPKISIVEKKNA